MKIQSINSLWKINNLKRVSQAKNISFASKPFNKREEELRKLNIDLYVAELVKNLPKKNYQRFLECVKRNFTAYNAYIFSQYDDKRYNRIIQLNDVHISEYSVDEVSEFDDERYEKFLKLKTLGFEELSSYFLSDSKSVVYDYALHYVNEGYEPFETYQAISKLSKFECERLTTLTNLGLDLKEAQRAATDDFLYNMTLNKITQKEQALNDVLADFSSEVVSGLSNRDRKFLRDNAFDNKFFNSNEYVRCFLYFKNFKTNKGENVFSADKFAYRINEALNMSVKQRYRENAFYSNIKAILNTNPASVEASYLELFFDLIKEGEINSGAVRKFDNVNCSISRNLKKDIDLYFDSKLNNKALKNEYIKTFKTEKEALKNVEIGDCFEILNENNIKIKTDENKANTLQMSKDTYFRLFPPLERFSSSQQALGDCYFIETIMNLYSNPKSRYLLLNSIKEDNNGDITIEFSNNLNTKVLFKNGKIPNNENIKAYSSGAYGFKLFEYAYGALKIEELISKAKTKLKGTKLEEFEKFLAIHKDDIYIYDNDDDEIKWTTFKNAIDKKIYQGNKFDSVFQFYKRPYNSYGLYLLGNGGQPHNVLNALGFKNSIYIPDDDFLYYTIDSLEKSDVDTNLMYTFDEIKDEFLKDDFFKNHVVQFEINSHLFGLNRIKDENGKYIYEIFNPHNQAIPEFTENPENILKSMKAMTIAEINV